MDSIVTTEDTIAAIASAISIGKGGVAIIRVSGKDSINSCKKIVQTKSKHAWESHRVFHGFIQENKQNRFIDEVLILVMKSPNSFTGEDVVELHCHGGIIIVNNCLLYTSDAADEGLGVDLGGRRIIKKRTSILIPK